MHSVIDPAAACLNELARSDRRRPPDDRDWVSPSAPLDAHHTETVLRIVERHALHHAGQTLRETDPRTGEFRRNEDHPPECDLLVIDEASMIDVLLMRSLLRAVPDQAAVLIVGDADQLPSVGPGQLLKDIIASGIMPEVRLTEVFRQTARSRVIANAHRINHGEMPDLSRALALSDFYFLDAAEPDDAIWKITTVVRDRISQMNRGGLGARSLNCVSPAAALSERVAFCAKTVPRNGDARISGSQPNAAIRTWVSAPNWVSLPANANPFSK
jgi:hypothetical protein